MRPANRFGIWLRTVAKPGRLTLKSALTSHQNMCYLGWDFSTVNNAMVWSFGPSRRKKARQWKENLCQLEAMNRVRHPCAHLRGFTLMELLLVLLILGILAGLLFSVSDGIFGRGQRERARSELEAIQVALEAYRERFADYPEVVGASPLLEALEGRLGPRGDVLSRPYPPFLVASNFSLSAGEAPELLDPWGVPYVYVYQKGVGRSGNSSYLLFSAGPDGEASPDGRGSDSIDHDNVWSDD